MGKKELKGEWINGERDKRTIYFQTVNIVLYRLLNWNSFEIGSSDVWLITWLKVL